MEETQNNCQSPSDWGSMQDLTSWSFNDHENGVESAQNYTGGSCQWSQGSWDHSYQENIVTKKTTHYAVKDWNPATPARSPCSRNHMYWPVWSLPMIQRRTGWKCCGQIKLNSQCLEEEECCLWPQEHHPHRQTWRWKRYALGVFFC